MQGQFRERQGCGESKGPEWDVGGGQGQVEDVEWVGRQADQEQELYLSTWYKCHQKVNKLAFLFPVYIAAIHSYGRTH